MIDFKTAKPGQIVWFVPDATKHSPHEVEILAVGRLWHQLGNGRRMALDGQVEGLEQGRCYPDRQTFEDLMRHWRAYWQFQRDILMSNYESFTPAQIELARAALGLKEQK